MKKIKQIICLISAVLVSFIMAGSATEEKTSMDEYFESTSTVVDKIRVKDSKEVLTEREAVRLMEERGFTQYPVTWEYDMDGNYQDERMASAVSETKHPMYSSEYISETGDVWSLLIIEDSLFAIPFSYNLGSGGGVQTTVSESETIVSYDSSSNCFYKTIPFVNVMKVEIVSQIDASTLNSFDSENIQ